MYMCAHKHTCRLADTRHWHSSCEPGPQLWLPQDIWGLPPQNRSLWSFQSPGACNQPYHTRGPFQSIATHSRENWTLRPNYGVFTIIYMLCHCIHVVYMHVNMHCVCINTPSSVTTVWFDETQLNMSFKSERLCVSTHPDMMLRTLK